LWDERRDLAAWLRVRIDHGSRAVFQDELGRRVAAMWLGQREPAPVSTLPPGQHPGQQKLFEDADLDQEVGGLYPAGVRRRSPLWGLGEPGGWRR
jgi:hypothetical protein